MSFWRNAQAALVAIVLASTSACSASSRYAEAKDAGGATPADMPVTATGGSYPQSLSMRMDSDDAGAPVAMEAAPAPMPGGGGGDFAKREEAPGVPPPTMGQTAGQPAQPAPKPTPKPGQQGAGAESRQSPILIYTADFTMSVYEVTKSLDAVEGIAKAAGGYLARRDDRSITIRVPAEKFQEVVNGVEKVGDVTHRNVVSEDVTAEYRDLEVQLQNLLALRLRFEKLLEKANKVEEALQIERELGRITGEIERIKGRLKLLTDLAQYSTITVTFQPRVAQNVQEGPFVLPLPWLNGLGLRRLMSLR